MMAHQSANLGNQKNLLIFVVGNSRSGTTMMGRILGRHPEVFTFHELHFFEQLWTPTAQSCYLSKAEAEQLAARLICIQRDGYLTQGNPDRFSEESQKLIVEIQAETLTPAEVFEAFLLYEAAKHGKRIPCDQTPRNVFYISEILELYPEARLINMIRDPRDVLLSQKGRWKRRFLGAKSMPIKATVLSWINYHPITTSKLWNSSIGASERFAGNERVYSVHFENLLSEPEKTVQNICEFVGISFESSLLEVPQIGSSIELDNPDRKGINPERAGSWQKGGLSSTEVFLCQWVTKSVMESHGYNLVPIRPNLLLLIYSVITLPMKLALALLFNLKRMQNLNESIRRRLT